MHPGKQGGQSADNRWPLPDFGSHADPRQSKSGKRSGYQRQSAAEAAIKSVVRSVGKTIGRELVRKILGSLR